MANKKNKCKSCNSIIPNWVIIDGIRKNLSNRSYCLECSPINKNNATEDATKTVKSVALPDKPKTGRQQPTKPKSVAPKCSATKTTTPTTSSQIKLDTSGNPRHLFSIDEPKYRCGYNRDHCIDCGYEYDKIEFRKGTRKCGDCFWAISSAKIIQQYHKTKGYACESCKRRGHEDIINF